MKVEEPLIEYLSQKANSQRKKLKSLYHFILMKENIKVENNDLTILDLPVVEIDDPSFNYCRGEFQAWADSVVNNWVNGQVGQSQSQSQGKGQGYSENKGQAEIRKRYVIMLNGYLGLYFKMNNSLPVNLLVTKNTSFKSFLNFFTLLGIGYSGPRCV